MSKGLKDLNKFFSKILQTQASEDRTIFEVAVTLYNEKIAKILEAAGINGEPLEGTAYNLGGKVAPRSETILKAQQKRMYSTSSRTLTLQGPLGNHQLSGSGGKEPNLVPATIG